VIRRNEIPTKNPELIFRALFCDEKFVINHSQIKIPQAVEAMEIRITRP
jgi:hypothetical protein